MFRFSIILMISIPFAFASGSVSGDGREFSAITQSSGDYRLDENGDGKVDILRVTEEGVSITSRTVGEKSVINIVDGRRGEIVDVTAEVKNGAARITSLKSLPKSHPSGLAKPLSSFLSGKSDLCPLNVENEFKSFSTDLNKFVLRKKVSGIWDEGCAKISGFQDVRKEIEDGFVDTISVDSDKNNLLLDCLAKAKASADDKKKSEIGLWLLQMKANISAFYTGDAKQGVFTCAQGNLDSLSSNKLSTKIEMTFKDGSGFSDPSVVRQSFYSSFLQNVGIPGNLVGDISKMCLKRDYENSNILISKAAVGVGATGFVGNESTTQAANSISEDIRSNSKIAGINKKLAEVKIALPSAEETSPRALAAIERTQGPEAAQAVARSQSSSLMNAANTIMGAVNTPAVAQSRGLASTSTPQKVDSVKFGNSVVGTRAPALKQARGVASDEYIAEEIDLTKKRQNSTAKSANNSRLPATAGNAKSANKADRNTPAAADEGEEGSSGGSELGQLASGGGSRPSFSSTSGSGNQQPLNARSTNSASAGDSYTNLSRNNVVSIFRTESYQEVRERLKDPDFIRSLARNDITIMNRVGKSFGAPRGSIVFMDEGGRFVRKK